VVLRYQFLYALRREVLRNSLPALRLLAQWLRRFYTPFGVRCFGTCEKPMATTVREAFLYALRREVLRNLYVASESSQFR